MDLIPKPQTLNIEMDMSHVCHVTFADDSQPEKQVDTVGNGFIKPLALLAQH
jgi:hypothetical protein